MYINMELICNRDFCLWTHGEIWKRYFNFAEVPALPAPSLATFALHMVAPSLSQSATPASSRPDTPLLTQPSAFITSQTSLFTSTFNATPVESIIFPLDLTAKENKRNPTTLPKSKESHAYATIDLANFEFKESGNDNLNDNNNDDDDDDDDNEDDERKEWKKNWTRQQMEFASQARKSNTFVRVHKKVSGNVFCLHFALLIGL